VIPATHDLARLWQRWKARLGDDDETMQSATHYLGLALKDKESFAEARELDHDTLNRATDCRARIADRPKLTVSAMV
jgi:hypothetical protein